MTPAYCPPSSVKTRAETSRTLRGSSHPGAPASAVNASFSKPSWTEPPCQALCEARFAHASFSGAPQGSFSVVPGMNQTLRRLPVRGTRAPRKGTGVWDGSGSAERLLQFTWRAGPTRRCSRARCTARELGGPPGASAESSDWGRISALQGLSGPLALKAEEASGSRAPH